MTDIDKLQKISADLGNPGVDKLFIAARRRGLQVTKRQVKTLLSRLGDRQIFRAVQPSKGKTASEDIDTRFQMDLIDLHNDAAFDKTGDVNKFILILINVFTREVYAETLGKKEPKEVSEALASMLDKLPIDPKIISSDNGKEFLGPVTTMLQKRDIAQKFKEVGDINALGVVDKAIQTLKKNMARILTDEKVRNWKDALKKAVKGYNDTYHSSVHDAPSDVRGDDKVMFMNLQDNAAKFEHNQQLFEKRVSKLMTDGAFHAPLPNSTQKFKRGYQATYGGVTNVKELQGSTVIGENGVAIDIKRVLSVPEDSTDAVGRLGEVNTALGNKKREITENVMRALYDYLENKEQVSLVTAAKHLRSRMLEYDKTLEKAKVNLIDIIRLYPEFLKLTGAKKLSKDYYYVKRVE